MANPKRTFKPRFVAGLEQTATTLPAAPKAGFGGPSLGFSGVLRFKIDGLGFRV